MTARAAFTQIDVTRAIRGAKAAGCDDFHIQIEPDGRLVIIVGTAAKQMPDADANPWDDELP